MRRSGFAYSRNRMAPPKLPSKTNPATLALSRNVQNLRVVLVATRNPLNIGAVARAMSNFGATHLRLVNPYEPSFREARSAVGAAELLAKAKEYSTVAEAVADCHLVVGTTAGGRRVPQLDLRRLELGAPSITQELPKGPVALLFGSEKTGLSNHDMSHCHWLMRIPTREAHGSMNLGQAVAVCLYELVRETVNVFGKKNPRRALRKRNPPIGDIPVSDRPAQAGDVERLTKLLNEVLTASGYIKPKGAQATGEKIRRMLRRLDLSAADAELWLGMVRQIQWKLGAKP